MSERQVGRVMTAIGTPLTLVGAAMYFLPGPDFPVLIIGLALLITGLVMQPAAGSTTGPVPERTPMTMAWQWIGLTVFSLTLLPAGLAMAAGWAPARWRTRLTPVRARGGALLALYAAAPLNAIPRLAGASAAVSLPLSAAAGIVAVAGCLAAALASLKTVRYGAR
ncbi:hypothetical protein [Streptomyces sp900116325]|uniref:hypothetical protein n=1 Tax=Streptomyces sp. 900116325 TaxID=3154295 RepID=UPI0033AAFACC